MCNKNWLVPIRITLHSTAFVSAASAEEAAAKVQNGHWEFYDDDEVIDWELLCGPAEPNE